MSKLPTPAMGEIIATYRFRDGHEVDIKLEPSERQGEEGIDVVATSDDCVIATFHPDFGTDAARMVMAGAACVGVSTDQLAGLNVAKVIAERDALRATITQVNKYVQWCGVPPGGIVSTIEDELKDSGFWKERE